MVAYTVGYAQRVAFWVEDNASKEDKIKIVHWQAAMEFACRTLYIHSDTQGKFMHAIVKIIIRHYH